MILCAILLISVDSLTAGTQRSWISVAKSVYLHVQSLSLYVVAWEPFLVTLGHLHLSEAFCLDFKLFRVEFV